MDGGGGGVLKVYAAGDFRGSCGLGMEFGLSTPLRITGHLRLSLGAFSKLSETSSLASRINW